ncbi:PAS domain S-box protein [Desulfoferrobacter suflitae]|uniref:PAS domain S-box protein n=1 Tax=Desulfoferrobacter suflitae TaxID=2865782 RepID=UPI0021647105|nr:PAS domain S-box protein [Desulfoferrobacter suflitae]MCK8602933.1 PAS domain S-box protein [Desulfoferrobacter suflitae]
MANISFTGKALSQRYLIPLYLILIAAGLVGNYFALSILNAHFIFGSIFALLALQMFGWRWGVVAGALISSCTYVTWNHPWGILTMTMEVAVVGWLITWPKLSLVMADGLYWIFIGIPLGYFFMQEISNFPASNALFLMTKQGINGIANALAARLIFTTAAFRCNAQPISFREIISNLMIFFVLCPSLILLAIAGKADLAETERRIRESLVNNSLQVTDNLHNWLEDRQQVVVQLAQKAATLPPQQMQPYLEQVRSADKNFLRIGLLDKHATVVAFSPPNDELGRPMLGRSYADRSYLAALKQVLKPMLSEVFAARFGRPEPIAIMLAPVLIQGGFNGYLSGVLNLERIHRILQNSSSGLGTRYTLLDRNGHVIVTNRDDQKPLMPFSRGTGSVNAISQSILQWVPQLPRNTSTIELWGKSVYLVQSNVGKLAEWKLILEDPAAPYQKKLYDRYTSGFIMLFAIVVTALVLAEFLGRCVVKPVQELGKITHNLPARVESGSPIDWPAGSILETSQLVDNFKAMADSLTAKFVENRQMNEQLEQRVAERTEELRRSREFLDNIVENIPAMIFMKDAAQLRFVKFNRAGEELLGYSREELLGKCDYDFFPREQADFFVGKDREALSQRGVIEVSEEPTLTRHQGIRILRTKKIPLLDKQGKPEYLLGIAEDITERKRMEAHSRQLLGVIEKSLNEIYIFDSQSLKFRYVNHGALKNLQYTLEEIKQLTPLDLKPEFTEQTFRAAIQPLLDNLQQSLTLETVHRRADGSLYPVEVCLQLIDADGDRVFLAVMFDITERRRAEEEREKLKEQLIQAQKIESIGRLAGGVAHDYNNMLGVIIGYGELALSKVSPDDPLQEDLEEILKAAKRSAQVTRQLLAFARKQTIAPKLLDLNETVEKMLKMLRRLIGEDIDLAWLPGSRLWPVKMDHSQIDQILANLCVNSRDAIAGVGKITIETRNAVFDEHYCAEHAECTPGKYVMMAVSDNGCGMDRESFQHLFEPFYTTKELGKGTGLGLATVYGIIKQNQGFINVYSEPGRGTTFKIYLPRWYGAADHEVLAQPAKITPNQGETVLLVEDEPALLKMDQKMLEQLGYRVLAADSPIQALRLAESHPDQVHLLLTDVVMPQMTGQELSHRLQTLNPTLKCLFMSGYTADVIAQHGVLDNTVHFIQKPFSIQDLAAKIRTTLEE